MIYEQVLTLTEKDLQCLLNDAHENPDDVAGDWLNLHDVYESFAIDGSIEIEVDGREVFPEDLR